MAATRAMLYPASPAGWPLPTMRSSTLWGSSAGTFSRTALTTRAVRSSGRHSTSDPLLARPIGVRPVATMTASGMRAPRIRIWRRVGDSAVVRLPRGNQKGVEFRLTVHRWNRRARPAGPTGPRTVTCSTKGELAPDPGVPADARADVATWRQAMEIGYTAEQDA